MATRIEADLLVPGAGEPLRNGCVILEGRSIAYAGPIEAAPRTGSSDTVVHAPAVLPGLWDCHAHFMGLRRLSMEEQVYTTPWMGLARSTVDAQKALRAGFTSVREVGGFGIRLAGVVNEGTLPGPHIYASGTALSVTGGHGDAHAYPLDFVHYMARMQDLPGPCDGVAECLRAVRQVLRLGAPVVKICASGGVLSDFDDPVHQQFSEEELRAIVEEAGRADRIVAAHCHGKPGIMAALNAGVKTIEHGTYLDDEGVDLMLAKKAILVPTRTIVAGLVRMGEATGLPEFILEKARKTHESHLRAMRLAIRRGVPVALGTDTLGSSEEVPAHWGANGGELVHLVEEGGMTPLQAIEAATARAPQTLGPQAPRSGRLEAGYDADVIVVREDPLKRIRTLAEPKNVLYVWKDGQLAVDRSKEPF